MSFWLVIWGAVVVLVLTAIDLVGQRRRIKRLQRWSQRTRPADRLEKVECSRCARDRVCAFAVPVCDDCARAVSNASRVDGFCCSAMARAITRTRCDLHPDPEACPDSLISRTTHGYGIRIHDGGGASQLISFCPWCGGALR